MLTVACVLRTEGGSYPGAKQTGEDTYDAEYVARLQRVVQEHLDRPHRFVCLSDTEVPCERIPLEHDWPGWWSKIELHRPENFDGRVLYLDLDTSVVGSLEEIASYDGSFGMINDWIHDWHGASGVMAWEHTERTCDLIYGEFLRSTPEGAMASHRGHQSWVNGSVEWDPLREMYPGQIVSRWLECEAGVPENARIVCWHGTPRPRDCGWELTGGREEWREGLGDERHIVQGAGG